MKLTLVIPAVECGGAERKLSIMANYWASEGMEVSVLTFDDGTKQPFYELAPSINREALKISPPSKNIFHAVWKTFHRCRILRKKIKETKPDIVIPFMEATGGLILMALMGLPVPVLVVTGTPFSLKSIPFLWYVVCALLFPFAAGIVVQTQKGISALPWYCRSKAIVIPNPVPPPSTISEKGAHREKTIISVGRLRREKGHDLLLKAFAMIASQHPDWRVALIGDGPFRPVLEALRDEFQLKDQIQFRGVSKNIEQELSKAGLFVLPSRWEGFPNALCEAMACGVPVISFDVETGPRDIIRHGVDGLLVPAQDIRGLAEAMKNLIENEEKRRGMAKEAENILDRFGIQIIMRRWDGILNSMISRGDKK